jgi:hypothetical protein
VYVVSLRQDSILLTHFQFETAPGLPALAVAPINLYLDIFWNGMSLVETINPLVTGVVANSPLNYAAFSTLDVATVQQGQPAMTVNYADSTVDHFDLKSFYYGCALGSEASVAGVPLPCMITVRGYSDYNGEDLVATQNFDYKVGFLQLQTQMQKAVLSSGFKGVKKVEFDVSDELITAGLIDTVFYTVYSTERIGN